MKFVIRIKENFSRYNVSNTGKIFDRKYQRYSRTFKSNKYLQCRLVDDEGHTHIMGVHVAIAMFHLPDYYPGCVVHHKNGNTIDNVDTNLECLSRRAHSSKHADAHYLVDKVRKQGPWNKGIKMSPEFCKKCSDSAKCRWHK